MRWFMIGTVALCLVNTAISQDSRNLLADPSFEECRSPNQFGQVFPKWAGWKFAGECDFKVGAVAHSGASSCLLAGYNGSKIRMAPPKFELEPGRYRVTAWLRGLDIGLGPYRESTEFMFDGNYIPLGKNGDFGWTPLTYVGEITTRKMVGSPSFGLMTTGFLWIDDVTMVRVPDDTPLTPKPVLGDEQAPIAPPAPPGPAAVRCPLCSSRNALEWGHCYACGTKLEAAVQRRDGPPVSVIASFEDKPLFQGKSCSVVEEHATEGRKALRLDSGYAILSAGMNFSGYDFLKLDVATDAMDPVGIIIELGDTSSREYWTRVNYTTVIPPGKSTLVIPVRQLYVGEKSRPGRMLDLANVNRFAISHEQEKPAAPVFLDNIRLEVDEAPAKAVFDGLHAFDFGTGTSPVMDGFTKITPATSYSRNRGYGLKDAKIWRGFDALQPDPLYQDFICIESGGLAVDVPNGDYHVFVNMDSPSGYWGEYQAYTKRAILAQGRPVVVEEMTFADQARKYFRFWDTEDLPSENTFDKYQKPYFQEKQFKVSVTNGLLEIGFQGKNWACCVSTVILYPVGKAAEGDAFLKFVEGRRRFYFDNYFKRILARPTGYPLTPAAEERTRGYVLFHRDPMREISYNDTPAKGEACQQLGAEGFAGEFVPLTLGLVPLRDLGTVTVAVSDLTGNGRTIPAASVDVGFVSYRVMRVSMEGSVYTIGPRLIMPTNRVACPPGVTRRFWCTIRTPEDIPPGLYRGVMTVAAEKGGATRLPVVFRVRSGTLDPVDIPAGPWGHAIRIPWVENDPAADAYARELSRKSLQRIRDYGFTLFSGAPTIRYLGFKDGRADLDFALADAQMKQARELGFLAVVSYGGGGVLGIKPYVQDKAAMEAAGFTDYSAFIKAVYSAVQNHAEENNWLPVYYNLCDEPIKGDVLLSAENAEAYRHAFPDGPPFFTGATSYGGSDPADPHMQLSKALHVANWNTHSEASVKLLHEAGGAWAFYNGGDRWTYGDYLYKAATQFNARFRIAWYWNIVVGDPYYALDCREDDYAWCNSTPDGRLVPSLEFERIREGLGDYRRLKTLKRLAMRKPGTPAAVAAESLIANRMASFTLGQRDHDALFGAEDWAAFRAKVNDAIEALQ